MTTPATRKLTFNVLVERHDTVFVGHCLETGLVAVADELNDVLANMGKLLEREIVFALKHDRLGDIYHKAPDEIWSKWMKMEAAIGQSQRVLPIPSGGTMRPGLTIDQTAYAAAC